LIFLKSLSSKILSAARLTSLSIFSAFFNNSIPLIFFDTLCSPNYKASIAFSSSISIFLPLILFGNSSGQTSLKKFTSDLAAALTDLHF
jgi:hypothetical protein